MVFGFKERPRHFFKKPATLPGSPLAHFGAPRPKRPRDLANPASEGAGAWPGPPLALGYGCSRCPWSSQANLPLTNRGAAAGPELARRCANAYYAQAGPCCPSGAGSAQPFRSSNPTTAQSGGAPNRASPYAYCVVAHAPIHAFRPSGPAAYSEYMDDHLRIKYTFSSFLIKPRKIKSK